MDRKAIITRKRHEYIPIAVSILSLRILYSPEASAELSLPLLIRNNLDN